MPEPELTPEQLQDALKPPPARPEERPRAQRRAGGQPTPPQQQPQPRLAAVGPSLAAAQTAPITTDAAAAAAKRLAHRTAEQTFLPLVSKLAKLGDVVAEVEVAVEQALAAGVDRTDLSITLLQAARKGNVEWGAVPESIRILVSDEAGT